MTINGLEIEHPLTVAHMVEHLGEVASAEVCLLDGDEVCTFGTLRDRARRLAGGLADRGVGPGDVVALWLPSSVVTVELTAACGYLGAVVLGVNTKLRSHDVLTALRDSGATVLVTARGFRGIDFLGMLDEIVADLPAGLTHLVTVGHGETVAACLSSTPYDELPAGPRSDVAATPDSPAQAFSSSGTTSTPKLVLQSHRSLVHHAYAVASCFGYRGDDTVVLGSLPFCGVFGYNTLLAAMAAARPLVVQAVFDADQAVGLIRAHRVTHTNLSDEMLRRILDTAPLDSLPTWRECGFGNFTAIDAGELVDTGARAGRKFFQTYGSSEVLALMTYPGAGTGPDRWRVGGGEPISEQIQVRVCDEETGTAVADGASGEIEVKGVNVTCGYLNRDGLDDLDDDGWFRTGDLGHFAGGDMVYLSRKGDALRLGGFLVSPREIEEFLERDPLVREAQIVGVDTTNGPGVVGFVLVEDRDSFDEDALLEECRGKLARFKVPRRLLVLDEFPLSHGANGVKIQRNRLRDHAGTILKETGQA